MSYIFHFRSRLSPSHINVAFPNFLLLQIIDLKKWNIMCIRTYRVVFYERNESLQISSDRLHHYLSLCLSVSFIPNQALGRFKSAIP